MSASSESLAEVRHCLIKDFSRPVNCGEVASPNYHRPFLPYILGTVLVPRWVR